MGYTETFHGTITTTVRYSYPASEHGGSGHKTVTEPVEIRVHIDDDPLLASAGNCSLQLISVENAIDDGLKKQVQAKSESAKKISSSILSGFFGYTKADFSQKMVELENITAAELPKLMSYFGQLRSIKDRMEFDFGLLRKRYIEIFSSLDEELEREMTRLYSPCFELVNNSFSKIIIDSSLSSLSLYFGYQTMPMTESALLLSYLKARLLKAMKMLADLSDGIRMLDKRISRSCQRKEIGAEETICIPALVFERISIESGESERDCILPNSISQAAAMRIRERIGDGEDASELSEKDKDLVEMKFLQLVTEIRDEQKRKMVLELWAKQRGGENGR